MGAAKEKAMSLYRSLLGLAIGVGLTASPALADRPRDQDRAYIQKQRGQSMPLPKIEQRVLPRMGGADYLGPEMRGRNLRMKFMDRGKVIWVDVDPMTGRILGKSDD